MVSRCLTSSRLASVPAQRPARDPAPGVCRPARRHAPGTSATTSGSGAPARLGPPSRRRGRRGRRVQMRAAETLPSHWRDRPAACCLEGLDGCSSGLRRSRLRSPWC
jgi:hypothetical protein